MQAQFLCVYVRQRLLVLPLKKVVWIIWLNCGLFTTRLIDWLCFSTFQYLVNAFGEYSVNTPKKMNTTATDKHNYLE